MLHEKEIREDLAEVKRLLTKTCVITDDNVVADLTTKAIEATNKIINEMNSRKKV